MPSPPAASPAIPPAPTSPVGSCFHYFPTGCPKNGVAVGAGWIEDKWGPANGFAGEAGCTQRAKGLNNWCGVADIVSHYVLAVASPDGVPRFD